jgi:putative transposase
VIHHSDQGTQYTSIAFGMRCRQAGVRPSMGSIGDCFDNAMCESFFATLECELLDRRRFKTQVEARLAIFDCRSSYVFDLWAQRWRRREAMGDFPRSRTKVKPACSESKRAISFSACNCRSSISR